MKSHPYLQTTSAEVFGFTESQGGKPWFAGRQNEIKRLNSHVSTAKHNLIACTQAARDQPYNPDAQHQQQIAKQSPNTAKRVKRRLFTQWERDYWHTIGQQAEDAETRGDTYALYSLFSKLKVRKANSTRSSLRNVSRNPFAEAESWKDHFSKIQNGAVPVADRVWDSVPINPIPAQWLNDTPTTPELTRALAKMKSERRPEMTVSLSRCLNGHPNKSLTTSSLLPSTFGTPPVAPRPTQPPPTGQNHGCKPP